MSSDNKSKSLNLFQKVKPVDSFWSWNHENKNNHNNKIWRLDEKRFSPTEFFTRKDPEKEPYILGPGAGAGIGCGAGVGFGLVGGTGFSAWPWDQIQLVLGFGVGCGVGAGFGYGLGIGYGSSWEALKDDLLGKKKKKTKSRGG